MLNGPFTPWPQYTQQEADAVADVLRSNKVNYWTGEQCRTFEVEFANFVGCGSAIASSSLATEWIKGRTVDEALAIKNTEIVEELALPPVKIHCSVLAEDSIRTAINDWKKKNGHEVEDDHHHH